MGFIAFLACAAVTALTPTNELASTAKSIPGHMASKNPVLKQVGLKKGNQLVRQEPRLGRVLWSLPTLRVSPLYTPAALLPVP